MTTQDIKIRIGLEGAQQVKASAEQAGAALAKIGGAGEISAKQTAAAFRVLPAQLSDIAVQLQGGTNPLTVLLQQGSQIKDSFGGVGNTLKAFAAAINPVYLAVGAAAAVVGTLVLAYAKGAKEADEYRKAIVLTGNAAGTTVGQLNAMAASIAQGVGTQAKAAEVLAQLTASAGVSAGNIQLLAEAAIRLEREGGPAVEKTVAAFASLGK